jgi:hypothetical protein
MSEHMFWHNNGVTFVDNVAARIGSSEPSAYRLAKTCDGEYVLQGAYRWMCGSEAGHEWRNIETVTLDGA